MKTVTPTKFKETEIGLIPEEWSLSKISDVSLLITKGTTPTTIGGDFSNKGVRFLKVENLSDDGKILDEKLTYIDEESNNLLKRSILQENDILYSIAGTIGRVAVVEKDILPANVNQAVAIIRPDLKKINVDYFRYYLLSPYVKNNLTSKVVHAVQANLSLGEIGNSPLLYPEINEQKQIAEILSSLDEKIELNRQININLEKVASLLFKKWFVNIDDELPVGWRIGKLSDISNITIGRTPPRMQKQWFTENPKDVKWISIRDLGNSGIYINKTAEYLTKEAVDKFNIPVIPKNTVILSFKLTVGRVAITTEDMLSNEAIAHIKLKDEKLSPEYIYLALKKFDYSSLGSTSSIATAVNSKTIKDMALLIPDEQTIKKFTALIEPVFAEILEKINQIESLSQIRDSLLPRLMSGKIRATKNDIF